MKPIKCEVDIPHEDGMTIEIRKFDSIRQAKKYIKSNGIKEHSLWRKK